MGPSRLTSLGWGVRKKWGTDVKKMGAYCKTQVIGPFAAPVVRKKKLNFKSLTVQEILFQAPKLINFFAP